MSHLKMQVTLAILAAASLILGTTGSARAVEPMVIELTKTGCQFIESEKGIDYGFQPSNKADCERINAETGKHRLNRSRVLELKPGRYVFRVTNSDVPYELGFWVRGASLVNRALLPSVSGGGLTMGSTRDYEIELKPGEYRYSCPLNPTPDYRLIVQG